MRVVLWLLSACLLIAGVPTAAADTTCVDVVTESACMTLTQQETEGCQTFEGGVFCERSNETRAAAETSGSTYLFAEVEYVEWEQDVEGEFGSCTTFDGTYNGQLVSLYYVAAASGLPFVTGGYAYLVTGQGAYDYADPCHEELFAEELPAGDYELLVANVGGVATVLTPVTGASAYGTAKVTSFTDTGDEDQGDQCTVGASVGGYVYSLTGSAPFRETFEAPC